MSNNTKQLINLFEILPENDQVMLLELTRKLLIAYDPDYTKLLPNEKEELDSALADYRNGENLIGAESIDW